MKPSMSLLFLLLLGLHFLFTSSCEKNTITCDTAVPILPQVRESIPYNGTNLLRFIYGNDTEEATARVIKNEGLINGLDGCEDFIEASFTTINSRRNFSLLLSTSSNERDELKFDFRFGLAGAQPPQVFVLKYSQSDVTATDSSVSVVSNIDTMLAGFLYENLLLVTDQAATEDRKIVNFFYSNEFGLVQVSRINSPLITLIQ